MTTRQSGRDACFDVKPPIPLEHETTGVDGFRRGRELDVAQVLSDYWMYFAVVALAVIAYGFTRKRRREAEHDEVDL